MSRPSNIKTSKDAYQHGYDTGLHDWAIGGWPSQADFDAKVRDSFVSEWLRGWSDGNKDKGLRGMPLWATNPGKAMKRRRTPKRTARRGGRVMTVTTTSRVVKTTRMNPRGLSLEPYRRGFKFGRDRHTESVSHTHSSAHLRKMMRELFPGWSKEQHVAQIVKLGRMIHVVSSLWGRFADRAHAEVFPGKKRGFLDYKVSGVGREEYPERLKTRLRIAARQENTIVSAIHAHALMAGKAALRKAGITDAALASYRSNPRPSKTHIEFIIQGNYGQGWEDENTELTREDAKRSLREYRENGPGAYRLIRRRVKNDATNPRQYAAPTRARVVRYYRYGPDKNQVTTDDPTRFMPLADAMDHAASYTSVPNRYAHVMTRGGRIVKSFRSAIMDGNNPVDPRTAPTVRIPAVVRASIPAGSSDPRRAETVRLKVVRVAGARSNPGAQYWVLVKNGQYMPLRGPLVTDPHHAMLFKTESGARNAARIQGNGWRAVKRPASNPARLALRLSSATWRRLPKADRRSRGSVRFVRCKTSKRGTAHWLRCVVR